MFVMVKADGAAIGSPRFEVLDLYCSAPLTMVWEGESETEHLQLVIRPWLCIGISLIPIPAPDRRVFLSQTFAAQHLHHEMTHGLAESLLDGTVINGHIWSRVPCWIPH